MRKTLGPCGTANKSAALPPALIFSTLTLGPNNRSSNSSFQAKTVRVTGRRMFSTLSVKSVLLFIYLFFF